MSSRQNTLFKRMKSAKERFTKTKKALDGMLLRKLHKDGVYTPDQFNNTYVAKKEANSKAEKYAEEVLRNYRTKQLQSGGHDNQ